MEQSEVSLAALTGGAAGKGGKRSKKSKKKSKKAKAAGIDADALLRDQEVRRGWGGEEGGSLRQAPLPLL